MRMFFGENLFTIVAYFPFVSCRMKSKNTLNMLVFSTNNIIVLKNDKLVIYLNCLACMLVYKKKESPNCI